MAADVRWLIFHVSWPSLSEVSGSATEIGVIDNRQIIEGVLFEVHEGYSLHPLVPLHSSEITKKKK